MTSKEMKEFIAKLCKKTKYILFKVEDLEEFLFKTEPHHDSILLIDDRLSLGVCKGEWEEEYCLFGEIVEI